MISFISGQTWLLAILHLMDHAEDLLCGKEVPRANIDHFLEMKYPEVYMDGQYCSDIFATASPPRTAKTHLPLRFLKDQLDRSPETRIICVLRNPKDTLVSYYHFYRMNIQLGWFNGTWDQFFEMVKEKDLYWGDYFDHIVEWYKFLKDRKNTLIIRYEEMKTNLKEHVVKIAEFIGKELSDEVIDIIVERVTFKNMAKDKTFNAEEGSEAFLKLDRAKFIRKGEVGDWKNYFNAEQNEYIEMKCKEMLDPLGLQFDYTL